MEDRVRQLEQENQRLRALLQQHGIAAPPAQPAGGVAPPPAPKTWLSSSHGLSKAQVERYSRHLLLPSFGLAAQERLCRGSVLIVGCGGLGSPAALYLAAAGVGRIGLVDHDRVELSNLHRQVIHTEGRVGQHKAESAAEACRALNGLVQVHTHLEGIHSGNALELVSFYDVVLDATDNPPTRYLISDACVVAGKPLVSAAAVGTDGQLTVYNYGSDGPCYRCLFPEAPAPENCSRCADAGVLGPVPGVMGVLQAVEVVKVMSGVGDVLARKLLIYDALSGRFTSIKLRGKQPGCVACGGGGLTADNLAFYDYVAFTGQQACDGPPPALALLPRDQRITAAQFKMMLEGAAPAAESEGPGESGAEARHRGAVFKVLDVRPTTQVELFSFQGAVHVPFEQLDARMDEVRALLLAGAGSAQGGSSSNGHAGEGGERGQEEDEEGEGPRLVVLCRRGNNSQRAVLRLRQALGAGLAGPGKVVDVVGGVEEWVRKVDVGAPCL